MPLVIDAETLATNQLGTSRDKFFHMRQLFDYYISTCQESTPCTRPNFNHLSLVPQPLKTTMANPTPYLIQATCPTCKQTILQATEDAHTGTTHETIRITPILLTTEQLAKEVLNNNTLYRIHQTPTGKLVAGKHNYTQTKQQLTHHEQFRPKYKQELGYAKQHQHKDQIAGTPINLTNCQKPTQNKNPPKPKTWKQLLNQPQPQIDLFTNPYKDCPF